MIKSAWQMHHHKVIIIVRVLVLVIGSLYFHIGCYTNSQQFGTFRSLPKPAGQYAKNEVIEKYLSGKDLDYVEGVWVLDNNQYEIAIIKNTFNYLPQYDYIGIITDTENKDWSLGETKLLLKKTASEYVYSVKYFMGNKSDLGTTFVMTNNNLGEMILGLTGKTMLIRSYPVETPRQRQSESIQISKTGTGFFITDDLIVTNYHVVADAKRIKINTSDKSFICKLVIKDQANDLAILKIIIEGTELEKKTFTSSFVPLFIGDVRKTKDGDKVFTIGYPLTSELGKHPRVSEGIINSV